MDLTQPRKIRRKNEIKLGTINVGTDFVHEMFLSWPCNEHTKSPQRFRWSLYSLHQPPSHMWSKHIFPTDNSFSRRDKSYTHIFRVSIIFHFLLLPRGTHRNRAGSSRLTHSIALHQRYRTPFASHHSKLSRERRIQGSSPSKNSSRIIIIEYVRAVFIARNQYTICLLHISARWVYMTEVPELILDLSYQRNYAIVLAKGFPILERGRLYIYTYTYACRCWT